MTDQTSEERPEDDAVDRASGFGVADLAAAGHIRRAHIAMSFSRIRRAADSAADAQPRSPA